MDIKKNYIADEILNSINFEKNSSNIEDAKKYTARRSLNFSGKDTNLSAISKRPSNILKVDLKQTLTFLGYGVTAYASSSMPIALLFSLFQMINEFLEMFNIELQREDAEVVWVIYRSNEDINLDNLFTIYSETFATLNKDSIMQSVERLKNMKIIEVINNKITICERIEYEN